MSLLSLLVASLLLFLLVVSTNGSSSNSNSNNSPPFACTKTHVQTVDGIIREAQCLLNQGDTGGYSLMYQRAVTLHPHLSEFHLQKASGHFFLSLIPNNTNQRDGQNSNMSDSNKSEGNNDPYMDATCSPAHPSITRLQPAAQAQAQSQEMLYLRVPKYRDGICHMIYQVYLSLSFGFHHHMTFAGFESLANAWGIDERQAFNFFFGDWKKFYSPHVFSSAAADGSRSRYRLHKLAKAESLQALHPFFGKNTKNFQESVVYTSSFSAPHAAGRTAVKVFALKKAPPFLSPLDLQMEEIDHNTTHQRVLFTSPAFLQYIRAMAACGIAKALSNSDRRADFDSAVIYPVAHLRHSSSPTATATATTTEVASSRTRRSSSVTNTILFTDNSLTPVTSIPSILATDHGLTPSSPSPPAVSQQRVIRVIRVVTHLRMGDAATNPQFIAKTLPFSFYYKLFALIHRTCRQCVFSVFTSVQSPTHRGMLQEFQRGLATLFQREGIRVSLFVDQEYTPAATSDALDTLAHMTSADVLITAKSTFSHVAALLNPVGCVLFFPTSRRDVYLSDWIVLPVDRRGKFSQHTPPHRLEAYEQEYLEIIDQQLFWCIRRATATATTTTTTATATGNH